MLNVADLLSFLIFFAIYATESAPLLASRAMGSVWDIVAPILKKMKLKKVVKNVLRIKEYTRSAQKLSTIFITKNMFFILVKNKRKVSKTLKLMHALYPLWKF